MEKKNLLQFFWQVTYAHTIAYFIAGASSMLLLNYDEIWATELISSFYRPIDSMAVALGPILQIPRGVLIALFILPLRKAFFEEKHGLLKLGLIVFGFAAISTIGAVWASFEGFIYLKMPLQMHLMGYPEIVAYISLFIGILYIAQKYAHKRFVKILPIIIMSLIVLMSTMNILGMMGIIEV
jgi:hypothetical protein